MDKPSASVIEKSVAGNKTRDKVFAIVGLISTFIGMLTLAALLFDLSSDGLSRIKPHFFTSFPSRFAGQAGILSCLGGHDPRHDRHRASRGADRHRRWSVS